jgi:hypothetical protein
VAGTLEDLQMSLLGLPGLQSPPCFHGLHLRKASSAPPWGLKPGGCRVTIPTDPGVRLALATSAGGQGHLWWWPQAGAWCVSPTQMQLEDSGLLPGERVPSVLHTEVS